MPKKALSINFPVERTVLSDVLPYEVPIVFSNRYYYKFLCEHSIKLHDGKISWDTADDVLDNLIKMLFGIHVATAVVKEVVNGKPISTVKLDAKGFSTVPFVFNTSHRQDQLRQLSLIHPKGQLQVIEFYDEHQDLIVYYCGRSSFSLRSPKRVAGCTYIDAKVQIELGDKADTLVEIEGENYENLRSFFVYERFSNVFKFYESREHLDSEREFQYLTKFDISSCFDSIYTHSIAWAVYGKEFSKRNLPKLGRAFPGKFDALMQRVNYNETNGILIGPEVSRIFAEIILQAVDKDVCSKLEAHGLAHAKNFRIYRYVDDFFVFYNDEKVCHEIRMALQESLKLYKMSLNKGKEETLGRPIITPISIAKKRVSDLFNRSLCYEISADLRNNEDLPRGQIYISKPSLITEFKSILSISGVEYGDVLNYSLSIVERKVRAILQDYTRIQRLSSTDKNLSDSLIALLGFVFFIYSVSPKVNTTIKLCRICQRILSFCSSEPIGLNYGAAISQIIYETCRSVIDSISDGENAKIEVMYLLVLMRQLGRNYRMDEVILGKCFGIVLGTDGFTVRPELNYFSIVSLLFYMQDRIRYARLRLALEKHILYKFGLKTHSIIGDSEMIHLSMDLLACPYVGKTLKNEVLKTYGVPANNLARIQKYNTHWFTKWGQFDFSKELDAKVSQQVY